MLYNKLMSYDAHPAPYNMSKTHSRFTGTVIAKVKKQASVWWSINNMFVFRGQSPVGAFAFERTQSFCEKKKTKLSVVVEPQSEDGLVNNTLDFNSCSCPNDSQCCFLFVRAWSRSSLNLHHRLIIVTMTIYVPFPWRSNHFHLNLNPRSFPQPHQVVCHRGVYVLFLIFEFLFLLCTQKNDSSPS